MPDSAGVCSLLISFIAAIVLSSAAVPPSPMRILSLVSIFFFLIASAMRNNEIPAMVTYAAVFPMIVWWLLLYLNFVSFLGNSFLNH